MNPFQRYRAAPIMPISFSGAAYHTWSCRFQLTSKQMPTRLAPTMVERSFTHGEPCSLERPKGAKAASDVL
mgnify:CR=1 FL=1